jgi:hypothetical protein
MTQEYGLNTNGTVWQRIFQKSKVNGAPYEEQQVDSNWQWPEKTYLQRRLEFLRTNRSSDESCESEYESQAEMTDTDPVGSASVSGTDLGFETDDSSENPIFIDIPSDDWIWCSNPMSDGGDGRNHAA